MSTRVPVKSILKTQPSKSSEPRTNKTEDKDRENLQIALKHAHRIQHQKDVQQEILQAIEELIDFPHHATSTSTKQRKQEAQDFKALIKPFQPTDLDDLIDERRIENRCGYVLCPRQPRASRPGAAQAKWKSRDDESEKFCGPECMARSGHVRMQLSSIPAWERPVEMRSVEVELLDEDEADDDDIEAEGKASGSEDQGRKSTNDPTTRVTEQRQNARPNWTVAQELAFERGESTASFKPRQVMTDHIVEKRHVEYRVLSSVDAAMVSHTAVEGYEPKQKSNKSHIKDAKRHDDDGARDDSSDTD